MPRTRTSREISELNDAGALAGSEITIVVKNGVNYRVPVSRIAGLGGAEGPQGEQGDPGADGADGSDGADGNDGADGANAYVYIAYASDGSGTGFTTTFNASLDYIAVLSTDTEIPSPSAGDFTGLWKNYKGATGATGATGSPGADGSDGADGNDGADGADGSVWYAGSSDPSSGTGADGDFYLQTGTGATGVLGDVWTKAAGSWSITGNIRGAAGAGSGDMEASTYDPTNVQDDAFDMDNMAEGADTKILTAAERSSIASAVQPGDLGTAAAANTGDFATAAQGATADSALQPADIGVAVQAYDAQLDTWAGVTPSSNGQSLVSAADYAAMRALLDLEAGTDFLSVSAIAAAYQPLDASLTAYAALTTAANKGVYYSAADTPVTYDLTTFGRALGGYADEAAFKAGVNLEIGVDVQAYDADLTTWGGKTAPSGTVVGTSDTQTLTDKTLTDPVIGGTATETVYTITDGAGFAINPRNGSLQKVTLGASRTPTVSGWVAGDSVKLMIADGTAYTITWTTIGVVWIGGSAPTLATSGFTHVILWYENSVYYGKYVGDSAS